MLRIERFVNQLMSSNCYLVVEEERGHCLCIDPASEKSEHEIKYIKQNNLVLDYILLTHEHTDHTWGVNALAERYSEVKVICSEVCRENLAKEFQAYFLLYYDNSDYRYTVCKVDVTNEELENHLIWQNHEIKFVPTPGHSLGSICIEIEERLFTGDAIMQSKPYINKRNGSKELFFESERKIMETYPAETLVYPGHGEVFKLKDVNSKT